MPPLTPYQKSLRLEKPFHVYRNGFPIELLLQGKRYNGSSDPSDPPEVLNLQALTLEGEVIELTDDEKESATSLLLS